MADDKPAATPVPVEHWVVSPEGKVGTVPADQVARASKEGYRPASVDEQIAAETARGADNSLASFSLGALSVLPGARAGIVRAAGGKEDAQIAARGARAIEATSPAANLAGTAAGLAGMAALGGPASIGGAAGVGAGLAGGSAAEESYLRQLDEKGHAELAPTLADAAKGGLAGALTGGVLGAAGGRVLPGLMRGAGPLGAAGRTIGAGFLGGGAGGAIFAGTESIFGDHALTGEQWLASVGKGALLGAAGSLPGAFSMARAVRALPGEPLPANASAAVAGKDVRATGAALDAASPGLAEAVQKAAAAGSKVDDIAARYGVPQEDIASAVAYAHQVAGETVNVEGGASLAENRTRTQRAFDAAIKFRANGDPLVERAYRAGLQQDLAGHAPQVKETEALVGGMSDDMQGILDAGRDVGVAEKAIRRDDAIREYAGADEAKYKASKRTEADLVRRSEGQPLEAIAQSALEEDAGHVTQAVDALASAREATIKSAHGEAKATEMAKLVPNDFRAEVHAGATEGLNQIRSFLGEWKRPPPGMQSAMSRLAERVGNLDIVLGKSKPSNRDVFMMLDDVKRDIGRVSKFGERIGGTLDESMAVGQARELYNRMQGFLEREDLFGAGGKAQAEINAPTSRLIGLGDHFTRTFFDRYGTQGGEPIFTAKPGAVRRLLEDPRGIDNATTRRGISDFLREQRSQWDAIEKHYELNPAAKKAIAEGRKAADVFEAKLADAFTRAETLDVIKAADRQPSDFTAKRDAFVGKFGAATGTGTMSNPAAVRGYLEGILKQESKIPKQILSDHVSSLRMKIADARAKGRSIGLDEGAMRKAEAAIASLDKRLPQAEERATTLAKLKEIQEGERDHALGGMIGLATDPFRRPLTTIGRVGRIVQTVANVNARISKVAHDIVGVKAAEKLGNGGNPEKAHPGASPAQSREAVIKLAEQMRQMSPEEMAARAKKQAGDMAIYAPKTAAMLAMSSMRALEYLQMTAPVPKTSDNQFQPQLKTAGRFNHADIDEYQDRVETTHDPVGQIEKMGGTGRISKAAVETLHYVWPLLFKQMQKDLATALATKTDPVSWQMAKTLSTLFETPAHETLTDSFWTAMQGAARKSAQEKKQAKQQGAPKLPHALSSLTSDGTNMTTPSAQIASG